MTKKKSEIDQVNKKVNKWFLKHKKAKFIIAIIVILIVIRVLLPYIVLNYLNKELANMEGYYGHIEDIDIALLRGGYVIDEIYLNKVDSTSGKQTDFFDSRMIDLSVEWRALFKGRLVGELEFMDPQIRIVKDKVEPSQLKADSSDFYDLLNSFMPLKVNKFEVHNGVIRYIDGTSNPKLDLEMNRAHILAENLSNVVDSSILPSNVDANASLYGGDLRVNMKLNALAKKPTFDLNAELKNTDLPKLNDMFKAYGKFDVNKGTFGLYTEVASKKGIYTGYFKPVIKDLDVLGPEDRKDSFLHKLWEGLVGTAGAILTNPKTDQIATKVKIEGDFNETKVGTLDAIIGLLRNAFIQAIMPAIDNEINLKSIGKKVEEDKKTFLQKVFTKDEKDKPKKKKK